MSFPLAARVACVIATLFVSRLGFADQFSWLNVNSQNFLGPVTDQGSAGSCEAFATVDALEARYELTRNDPGFALLFSAQNLICGGADNANTGGLPQVTLAYLKSTGVVTATELPYTARNSSPLWPLKAGWQKSVCKVSSLINFLPAGTASIKAELKEYGPLLVSVSASDLGTTTLGTTAANHAVVVVGYVDNSSEPGGGHWIVQNSWGTDFGSAGNPPGYSNIMYGNIERQDDIHAISGPAYVTGPLGSGTWNGGGGIWSAQPSVARWTTASSLPAATWSNGENNAVFSGTGGLLTLDIGLSAHGLIFKSGATGYSLFGGSLIVTAGGIVAGESVAINSPLTVGAPETWGVAAGKSLTVNGPVDLNISPLAISSTGMVVINGVIGDVTSDPVLAGLLTDTSSLTKSGTGLLVLNAANTFSSATKIASGTLRLGNPLALRNSAVNLAGGVLDLNNQSVTLGALSGTGSLNFGNHSLTLTNASGTYSGALSGSGALVHSGTGWQILRGKESYSGGTAIENGRLSFGTAASVPANGTITVGAGAYVGVGFNPTAANFFSKLNEANFLGVLGIETTVSGLNLTGFNPAVSVGSASTGILRGALTPASNTYNFGGGGGTLAVASPLADSSQYGVCSVEIGNGVTNPGSVILTGNNSYSGGTTLLSGTLSVSSDTNLGTGSLYLSNGTLKITGGRNFTASQGIYLSGSANLDLENNGVYTTLAGGIGGTGSLTVGSRRVSNYLGVLMLNGDNSYSGGTFLNEGIVVGANSDQSLGTGPLTFNGGMLSSMQPFTTSKAIHLAGPAYLDTTTDTLNGTITGSGSLMLDPYDVPGELFILNAVNTYTGETVIASGTLQIGNALALQDTTVCISAHGALDLGNFAATVGALDGSGKLQLANTLALGNATGNYSGKLSGSGLLLISGTNSQTLSGKDSYTGGTKVQSGILTYTNSNAIPSSGSISSGSGGYVGAGFSATNANFFSKFDLANTFGVIGIESKTGNVDLSLFNASVRLGSAASGTVTGIITPQSNVYRFGGGGGELTIKSVLTDGTASVRGVDFGTNGNLPAAIVAPTGTNTYSGGTTFEENGWARVSQDVALGSGNLTFNGGTLEVSSTTAFSSSKPITINYSNTPDGYDGWIMFDGTTTKTSLLSGPVTLNGTGLFWNEPPLALSGVISGTGAFVKSGTGVLTLSSAGYYTGGTVVRRGTLVLTGTIPGTVNVNSGATFDVSKLSAGFNVATGSTLTDNGTIIGNVDVSGTLTGSGSAGAVTMMPGGLLAAGATARTFTTANLSIDSNSTVEFQLSLAGTVPANENDLINVFGNLNVDGTLDILPLSGFGPGDYRLFNYSGSLSGTPSLESSIVDGYSVTIDTSTPDQINLDVHAPPAVPQMAVANVQGVPEPSTWAMLILGGSTIFGTIRLRKASAR